MGSVRFCLSLAAAAFAVLIQPAFAQDYRSRVAGGDGGAPFDMRCAQGDYLVGLSGRSGHWLDAIAPMCARWDANARQFLPPGIAPLRGGRGGHAGETRCDANSAINQLLIETAPNDWGSVGLLAPRCVNARETARQTARTGVTQFGMGIADRRAAEAERDGYGVSVSVDYDWAAMPQCRAGDVAVGIFGAAGDAVDRLGLICAPAPRAAMQFGRRTAPSRAAVEAARESQVANAAAPRCASGYVWREASPRDYVCVTPESRARARQENAQAASRVDPNGAYGPQSCRPGFVWREAFDGDLVCVTPEARAQVRQENAQASARVAR